jgi:hypothetical protein
MHLITVRITATMVTPAIRIGERARIPAARSLSAGIIIMVTTADIILPIKGAAVRAPDFVAVPGALDPALFMPHRRTAEAADDARNLQI